MRFVTGRKASQPCGRNIPYSRFRVSECFLVFFRYGCQGYERTMRWSGKLVWVAMGYVPSDHWHEFWRVLPRAIKSL